MLPKNEEVVPQSKRVLSLGPRVYDNATTDAPKCTSCTDNAYRSDIIAMIQCCAAMITSIRTINSGESSICAQHHPLSNDRMAGC